ncbi:uncharacterized protein SAPINGB_P006126 [Magnusiomyces paraingens]|uniref:Uncharacterized protein n=1 Tax=Magnusiomyces paraingens TaxID=2606893 RepID=A0A5E8C8J5_9ASCO|nr:uncharacterized protein SAPINGB_P006126 [Saprochaete ingens]VVT58278.1 unnamed protein product [Saprochaete ingens]
MSTRSSRANGSRADLVTTGAQDRDKPPNSNNANSTLTATTKVASDALAVMASANNNLSRFSRTVTTTASTLVASQYSSDLSGTYYHETMRDLARKPAFQKRFFSFSRKAPSEVMRSTLSSKDDIRFNALTAIPDELFSQIPMGASSQFSLFQGFQATTATLPEISGSEKAITDGSSDSSLTSRSALVKQRDNIYNTLDLLEIRKDLAANEINEIDKKIAYLQENRRLVFERIASLEQEEFQLENKVRHLSKQIDEMPEEEEEEEVKPTPEPPKNVKNAKKTKKIEKEDSDDSPLLSQSIFGKLQKHSQSESEPATTEKPPKTHRASTSRKTHPTLQQYYKTGDSIRLIPAHEDFVTSLDFDIPFGTMVSASVDDSCKVWDLGRGVCKGQLRGHNAYVTCLHMDGDMAVTGSMDASVRLWNLSGFEVDEEEPEDACLQVFEAHLGEITALHSYQDTLVTGSADKTIRQWDLRSGRCLQTLDVLWAAAQSSTPFAESGNWRSFQGINNTGKDSSSPAPFVGALQVFDAALASGTADGAVRLWDLRSGQVQRSLVGHTGPVTCLQFDDVYLTTGSWDRSIRVWDLRTGSIVDAFAYENPITALHFDARKIVSANRENTVKIYDRETSQHWTCGPGVKDEESLVSIHLATFKEGYLVEGRTNGSIGVWAC